MPLNASTVHGNRLTVREFESEPARHEHHRERRDERRQIQAHDRHRVDEARDAADARRRPASVAITSGGAAESTLRSRTAP